MSSYVVSSRASSKVAVAAAALLLAACHLHDSTGPDDATPPTQTSAVTTTAARRAGRNPTVWPDFDGDGKSDFVLHRNDGSWFVLPSTGYCPSYTSPTSAGGCYRFFGASGDIPVTGDFLGYGRNDYVVYRPSTRTFYIAYSNGTTYTYTFSGNVPTTGVPIVGDFNGDGKSDLGVGWLHWFDFTLGSVRDEFSVLPSNGASLLSYLGVQTAYPVEVSRQLLVFDFDNDGTAERATVVDRGTYDDWIVYEGSATPRRIDHGTLISAPTIKLVGDYTGDGLGDFVYWNTVTGNWVIYPAGQTNPIVVQAGATGDTPVTGDFDGDHIADPAVWRASTQTFIVWPSSGSCPTYLTANGNGGCERQWTIANATPLPGLTL